MEQFHASDWKYSIMARLMAHWPSSRLMLQDHFNLGCIFLLINIRRMGEGIISIHDRQLYWGQERPHCLLLNRRCRVQTRLLSTDAMGEERENYIYIVDTAPSFISTIYSQYYEMAPSSIIEPRQLPIGRRRPYQLAINRTKLFVSGYPPPKHT